MNSLDTAQIKQTTWEKLSGKWTPACLGFLFFFIILTVIDIPSIFFEEESIGQALYNSIWGPIEWALTWVLDIGIIAFYYKGDTQDSHNLRTTQSSSSLR